MKPRYSSILFIGLFACASSKQLATTDHRVEKMEQTTNVRMKEMTEKISELSDSLMILQDRLETVQLALEQRKRSSAPKVAKKRMINRAEKSKPRKVESSHPPFLVAGSPEASSLPTIKLTNQDLKRVDRETKASQPAMPSTSEENPAAVELYNQAFRKFEVKKYREATSLLAKFLQRFPKHSYSDNAVFWIGESFYQQQKFSKAAKQFERVAQDFPTGNKVPDALLRAGSCYLRLSQTGMARGAFERVVSLYPDSVAADKAQMLMAELSGKLARNRM